MSYLQNYIVKGHDNPVVLLFDFDGDFATSGLNNFNRIVVEIGNESYDTDGDYVDIHSDTELRIRIGTQTSLPEGEHKLTIIGYSTTYTNGYELTSDDVMRIAPVKVV
uniref:hypothetical protein n=1 Tax=Ningiella ruwaisensis TaxID=2364274 RepID=UPI0010A05E28|nr:hypothetical protein [Ningiella ruwaisensis]